MSAYPCEARAEPPITFYETNPNDRSPVRMTLDRIYTSVLSACVGVAACVVFGLPDAHADGMPGTGTAELEASVGWALRTGPRYMGAREDRAVLMPLVYIQYGAFFADMSSGIGLQYQGDAGFYVAQSLYYDLGRSRHNSVFVPGGRSLEGLGNVPGSVTSHTVVEHRLTDALSIGADADITLRSRTNRQSVRVGVDWIAYKTPSERLTIGVSGYWGNRQFNQAYFGVTAEQAGTTGRHEFRAHGGVYAYSAVARWDYRFTNHWYSTVQLALRPSAGQAAHSPLVERGAAVESALAFRYVY